MTYKKLRTDLERELLLTLIVGMKRNKISDKRAQMISKSFLQIMKSTDDKRELVNRVSILCQTYPEIVDGYLKTARKFEEEETSIKLLEVKAYLEEETLNIAILN